MPTVDRTLEAKVIKAIRLDHMGGYDQPLVDLLFLYSPDFLGDFDLGGLVVDDQVRNDVGPLLPCCPWAAPDR
jgi:hypothetical protein